MNRLCPPHDDIDHVCNDGDLTMGGVTVLSIWGRHVLSSDLLSHEHRIDSVSMRLYGAGNSS